MSRYTLAIDTSSGTSVALLEGERLIAEKTIADTMRHAEVIGDALVEVIQSAGAQSKEISAVVAGRGPAPFTGLRVGLAAAKLFAAGAKAPLFGVVSHDAIAYAYLAGESRAQVSETKPLLVITDARRKEVYHSLYSGLDSSGALIRIGEPAVMSEQLLMEHLADRGIDPIRIDGQVSAADIGRVFAKQLLAGNENRDVSALYLRAPDAVPSPGKKVSG